MILLPPDLHAMLCANLAARRAALLEGPREPDPVRVLKLRI